MQKIQTATTHITTLDPSPKSKISNPTDQKFDRSHTLSDSGHAQSVGAQQEKEAQEAESISSLKELYNLLDGLTPKDYKLAEKKGLIKGLTTWLDLATKIGIDKNINMQITSYLAKYPDAQGLQLLEALSPIFKEYCDLKENEFKQPINDHKPQPIQLKYNETASDERQPILGAIKEILINKNLLIKLFNLLEELTPEDRRIAKEEGFIKGLIIWLYLATKIGIDKNISMQITRYLAEHPNAQGLQLLKALSPIFEEYCHLKEIELNNSLIKLSNLLGKLTLEDYDIAKKKGFISRLTAWLDLATEIGIDKNVNVQTMQIASYLIKYSNSQGLQLLEALSPIFKEYCDLKENEFKQPINDYKSQPIQLKYNEAAPDEKKSALKMVKESLINKDKHQLNKEIESLSEQVLKTLNKIEGLDYLAINFEKEQEFISTLNKCIDLLYLSIINQWVAEKSENSDEKKDEEQPLEIMNKILESKVVNKVSNKILGKMVILYRALKKDSPEVISGNHGLFDQRDDQKIIDNKDQPRVKSRLAPDAAVQPHIAIKETHAFSRIFHLVKYRLSDAEIDPNLESNAQQRYLRIQLENLLFTLRSLLIDPDKDLRSCINWIQDYVEWKKSIKGIEESYLLKMSKTFSAYDARKVTTITKLMSNLNRGQGKTDLTASQLKELTSFAALMTKSAEDLKLVVADSQESTLAAYEINSAKILKRDILRQLNREVKHNNEDKKPTSRSRREYLQTQTIQQLINQLPSSDINRFAPYLYYIAKQISHSDQQCNLLKEELESTEFKEFQKLFNYSIDKLLQENKQNDICITLLRNGQISFLPPLLQAAASETDIISTVKTELHKNGYQTSENIFWLGVCDKLIKFGQRQLSEDILKNAILADKYGITTEKTNKKQARIKILIELFYPIRKNPSLLEQLKIAVFEKIESGLCTDEDLYRYFKALSIIDYIKNLDHGTLDFYLEAIPKKLLHLAKSLPLILPTPMHEKLTALADTQSSPDSISLLDAMDREFSQDLQKIDRNILRSIATFRGKNSHHYRPKFNHALEIKESDKKIEGKKTQIAEPISSSQSSELQQFLTKFSEDFFQLLEEIHREGSEFKLLEFRRGLEEIKTSVKRNGPIFLSDQLKGLLNKLINRFYGNSEKNTNIHKLIYKKFNSVYFKNHLKFSKELSISRELSAIPKYINLIKSFLEESGIDTNRTDLKHFFNIPEIHSLLRQIMLRRAMQGRVISLDQLIISEYFNFHINIPSIKKRGVTFKKLLVDRLGKDTFLSLENNLKNQLADEFKKPQLYTYSCLQEILDNSVNIGKLSNIISDIKEFIQSLREIKPPKGYSINIEYDNKEEWRNVFKHSCDNTLQDFEAFAKKLLQKRLPYSVIVKQIENFIISSLQNLSKELGFNLVEDKDILSRKQHIIDQLAQLKWNPPGKSATPEKVLQQCKDRNLRGDAELLRKVNGREELYGFPRIPLKENPPILTPKRFCVRNK